MAGLVSPDLPDKESRLDCATISFFFFTYSVNNNTIIVLWRSIIWCSGVKTFFISAFFSQKDDVSENFDHRFMH